MGIGTADGKVGLPILNIVFHRCVWLLGWSIKNRKIEKLINWFSLMFSHCAEWMRMGEFPSAWTSGHGIHGLRCNQSAQRPWELPKPSLFWTGNAVAPDSRHHFCFHSFTTCSLLVFKNAYNVMRPPLHSCPTRECVRAGLGCIRRWPVVWTCLPWA